MSSMATVLFLVLRLFTIEYMVTIGFNCIGITWMKNKWVEFQFQVNYPFMALDSGLSHFKGPNVPNFPWETIGFVTILYLFSSRFWHCDGKSRDICGIYIVYDPEQVVVQAHKSASYLHELSGSSGETWNPKPPRTAGTHFRVTEQALSKT